DDLGVKPDPVSSEVAELLDDIGGGRVTQQPAPGDWVGSVDRDIQRREPVLDDPLNVLRLEVGEGGKIAILEREPVIVVPDVEHLPEPFGKAVDEAEIAAVGAAADSGRLHRYPEGLAQGPFDVEFDLGTIGLANLEDELLFRGEKLPIEKV